MSRSTSAPSRAMCALVALLSAAAIGAPSAQAQDERAEGALFLLLPVGAQAVSLGRAMTWVEGAEGAFWNPAGLAGVDRSQAVVFRGDHVAGTATAATGLWTASAGSVGASYYLLDAGDIDQTDEFGNYTGTITIRNHLGVVSGATRLGDRVAAGVNLKVIRFQLACRGICADEGTTATTYAVDLGLQTQPTDRLRLGAMVAHLGPALQVLNAEQADPLPARVRLAGAYDVVGAFTESDQLRAWVALEVEDRVRDLGSPSVYVGTEMTAGAVDAFSLRAGWVWSDLDQEDGGRVGLGLRYERFDLSIAKSLAVSSLTGETEPVSVTFSIGF
ncbi:MAG: PorV/PorQ family protein [Gemmatimonadota bacterium]